VKIIDYRPECDACEWKGQFWLTEALAEMEGERHEDEHRLAEAGMLD